MKDVGGNAEMEVAEVRSGTCLSADRFEIIMKRERTGDFRSDVIEAIPLEAVTHGHNVREYQCFICIIDSVKRIDVLILKYHLYIISGGSLTDGQRHTVLLYSWNASIADLTRFRTAVKQSHISVISQY